MNLEDLKSKIILEELKLNLEDYGKILILIDFANINYWFEEDRQTQDYVLLKENEKIEIDIKSLKSFCDILSKEARVYYGFKENKTFIQILQNIFGKHKVFTKRIQKIRHYLSSPDKKENTRELFKDNKGKNYVFIDKCNFDVEISVDTLKLIDHYDSICLFSGDADFVHLLRHLNGKGKKIILIKGGNIVHELKDISNKIINAQQIKKYITRIKVKT